MQCINITITQTSEIETDFSIEFLGSTNLEVALVSSLLSALTDPENKFEKSDGTQMIP